FEIALELGLEIVVEHGNSWGDNAEAMRKRIGTDAGWLADGRGGRTPPAGWAGIGSDPLPRREAARERSGTWSCDSGDHVARNQILPTRSSDGLSVFSPS